MNEILSCANLFDGTAFVGPSRVIIEDGTVVAIEKAPGHPQFPILAPGFVDIQMNGFAEYDVAALDESSGPLLDELLLSLGTTTWLGTVVTAPLERLSRCIDRIHALIVSGTLPGCAGIHMEGPFLGAAPGAHNPAWIADIDVRWLSTLPSTLRLVTMAAEQDLPADTMALLSQRGVSVSIGHSRPTRRQFDEAVGLGATLVTHLYNGMSGVHHRDGGLALWALTDDRIRTGLIADMVHTSADAVALAFRSKGDDGVCLVSDSVAWRSERSVSSGVRVVDGAPRLPDGTIAGSSTCLAQCVSNVVNFCGVDAADALRAATSTPARAVGLPDRGHIKVGDSAHLLALDEALHVLHAWRAITIRT